MVSLYTSSCRSVQPLRAHLSFYLFLSQITHASSFGAVWVALPYTALFDEMIPINRVHTLTDYCYYFPELENVASKNVLSLFHLSILPLTACFICLLALGWAAFS
jgi:hypothetical protein